MHALLHKLFCGYISPSPAFGEFFTAGDLARLKRYWPFPLSGIGGHRMGAWLGYEEVLKRELFYFTFLRNPLKRYLSHLNWQMHIKKRFGSPEEFIADDYFDNFQCYRIAGSRHAEKACAMLEERFAFTGLLEEYDRSLLLWRHALGRPDLDLCYQRENVKDYGAQTIRREDLTDRLWKKIEEKNAEDMALYEWVRRELFPRQEQAYGPGLEEDLVAFRQLNEGYSFPLSARWKRKASNVLLGRILQPFLGA